MQAAEKTAEIVPTEQAVSLESMWLDIVSSAHRLHL